MSGQLNTPVRIVAFNTAERWAEDASEDNALRAIGAYKTGVHNVAGLVATIDGIGNVLGANTKTGPKRLAGSHLESQDFASWLDGPRGVVCALEAARLLWTAGRITLDPGAPSIILGNAEMPSDAGHDAQILTSIMPAGMLFVPSIGGINHHWRENTEDADIVTGAQVFVEACRRLLAE